MFLLKPVDGNSQYPCLPLVIKSGFKFASTNAESERSLSINARVVTSGRSALEKWQLQLCTLKGGSQVLEDERKKGETEQKEAAERIQKAKEEMAKSKQSLQDSEDTLMWEEEVVKAV